MEFRLLIVEDVPDHRVLPEESRQSSCDRVPRRRIVYVPVPVQIAEVAEAIVRRQSSTYLRPIVADRLSIQRPL